MTFYIEIVRSALAELSDADYQHRVLTGRGTSGEMSSFAECIEQLFGDSGLDLALERGHPVHGAQIDRDLRTLSDLVGQIDASGHPDQIVRDPAMNPVRKRRAPPQGRPYPRGRPCASDTRP